MMGLIKNIYSKSKQQNQKLLVSLFRAYPLDRPYFALPLEDSRFIFYHVLITVYAYCAMTIDCFKAALNIARPDDVVAQACKFVALDIGHHGIGDLGNDSTLASFSVIKGSMLQLSAEANFRN